MRHCRKWRKRWKQTAWVRRSSGWASPRCRTASHVINASQAGGCIYGDIVNETVERFDDFDGLIVGSPVYYGGPNGRLTSFLDRFLYSGAAAKCAGKIAASVVSCRRGGATAAFERLNQYFLMCNMHVAGSQYWNQVHGFTAKDVAKDEEGLQTMRTLAQNIAYLLKAKEAAAGAGIGEPVYEETVFTHFIR